MQNLPIDIVAVKAKAVARIHRNARKAEKQGNIQRAIRFREGLAFLEPELCRDAITWMRTREQESCLWDTLDTVPEIVPVMVRVLAEQGEDELAGRVAATYGIELEQVA